MINKGNIEKVVDRNIDNLKNKINKLHKKVVDLDKYSFIDEPSNILHQGIGDTILYDGKEVGGIHKSSVNKKGDVFIYNIEVLECHGRNVLRKIFEDEKVKTISGEATDDSYGFWKKMGAFFGEYIEANFATEFTITRKDFEYFNK